MVMVWEPDILAAQVASILREAGFSTQDLFCTFENFELHEGVQRAYELCQRYAAEFRPKLGWGFLLYGPVGVGKSHLAAATVRECVTKAVPTGLMLKVAKWKLPELLARGRSMFEDISGMGDLLENLSELDLVWLDEFATDVIGVGAFERVRAVETLYRVVDTLVEGGAGWLVTTNSAPERIYRELQSLDPTGRIADRLRGVLVPVRLSGESYRRIRREKTVPEWAKE